VQEINKLRSELLSAIDANNSAQETPNWSPIADRILVFPLGDDYMSKQTESGLFIPGEKRPWKSLVVSVSSKLKEEIAPGDVVITGKYIGEPVELGGKEYRLVREVDVLAILDE
jgi:co-chaperonin GroES (HSP10)